MNISAIKTFLTVVETGNLNRAAETLHITQSAVSTRLDTLEEQLGQKILIRSRKGAKMTKAGFAFHATAELIVTSWESARSKANLSNEYSGIFSFACHFDLWSNLGKTFLENAKKLSSDLAFEAWPGDETQIDNWLQSGMVDASIGVRAISAANIKAVKLHQERIVQVSTENRSEVGWDTDYIMVDHGAKIRLEHTMKWPDNNTAHMTFGGSEWATEYLLKNGGSAYLPWRLVEEHIKNRKLYLVKNSPEFSKKIHLSMRDNCNTEFPWLNELIMPLQSTRSFSHSN